jgi:uncharacterized protein YyaL (SSP411 family)
MPNLLSLEKSPYLLQHADNPVDWYPWGEEAFRKAREEDKPIFLSIGYATCHWCHVMEHESFEDEEVARLLNRDFIAIKVDREERPDIDRIYMTVCQVLTGGGGWPLSVFMTPERRPFFAGTYFPKFDRIGSPGLIQVVSKIADLWKIDRQRLFEAGDRITGAIQPKSSVESMEILGMKVLEASYLDLRKAFDPKWGGFGSAPKFPTAHNLTFLLRWHKRNRDSEALPMVEKTLDAMRNGGIFDQVGFGFHRYSVDERWFAPHFEKMLYDQAMLTLAYTEAFQVTGNARHAAVVREIIEYVRRDMTDPAGGFYSAEDADSEGREGLFYLWTAKEVKEVLGSDAGELFCRFHDISPEGNFERGENIAHISRPMDVFARSAGIEARELGALLEDGRRKLFAVRERRAHPFKDDKILTSWNGLMIAALSKASQALREPEYSAAASNAAEFILESLHRETGGLFRRYRHGEVAVPAYLDDYAFLAWGLIELYETTFEVRYLEKALRLTEKMIDEFWDEKNGGFFFTARGAEELILRDKEIQDAAVPSSNSIAALNLIRLARMTGDVRLEEKADRLLRAFSSLVADFPSAFTQFLNAVDFVLGPSREVVIAGDLVDERTRAMTELVQEGFSHNRVLLLRQTGEEGLRLTGLCGYAENLVPVDGVPTAYICEDHACRSPITDPAALKAAIS